jgi:N-acetylmuramoyl-L-alanine amidase
MDAIMTRRMDQITALIPLKRPLTLLCLAAALFSLSGCVTVRTRPEQAASLQTVCEQNGVNWYWDSVSQAVTMSRGALSARGMVGSEIVVIDQQKIFLSEPLKRQRGKIQVPADFYRKVILNLLGSEGTVSLRPCRIILDPGHGGKDPGAIGSAGTYEKDIVLDIAKRLKTILEGYQYDVKMTRADDTFIPLEQRTEIASQFVADLFISIHANASTTNRASGLEVYALKQLDRQEQKDPQRIKNLDILFRKLAMQRQDKSVENIVTDMLYSYKSSESFALAQAISEEVEQDTRARNRGVYKAGFFVLRNTLMPAVLVEVGFLSNAREERQLNSNQYRQKIAEGIARSLREYITRLSY